MTHVATPSKTATPTLLAFGVALKRARRAAHLTQAELAEHAGFSVVYISMFERGARQPQPSTVALLVEALALPCAERVALESAAQSPATNAARRRRGDDAATPPLPVGGYLGALPASMLVGRESELAVIQETLTAVASGQGRLLILVGEPGVGKTRLAQEITLTARAQGFRVVTGRCYEPQQSIAYAPFLEALTQAVALAPDAVEGWPEVARLLPSANHDAYVPAQLDDGAAQQRLFYQVRNFLGALVDRQPLAVLLDDLHWADGASIDLLQHLARHTRDQPILLVGTARAVEAQREHPLVDALGDLRHDELLERIEVDRLEEEETSALIGATLGGADGAEVDATNVSATLTQRIYARSEGNAFFIRQLTRALQEQGELTFSAGRWDLSAQDTTFTAPESIRSVIGRRLGRLTAHTQEVLREASVLGQVFAFDHLRGMSQRGEQEVEEALDEAAGKGIVREGQRDQYHFNHALTLETLYADLSARRRRRLHCAAGDVIESLPDHERRAAELSYHLLAADESERALPYTLLAGDQAEAVYAHAEAEGHYRMALEIARELGDPAHEAAALEKLGRALGNQSSPVDALDALDHAAQAYQALGDTEGELRVLAALAGAHAHSTIERAEAALARILPRLTALEAAVAQTGQPSPGLALATLQVGGSLYTSAGRLHDAVAHVERGSSSRAQWTTMPCWHGPICVRATSGGSAGARGVWPIFSTQSFWPNAQTPSSSRWPSTS